MLDCAMGWGCLEAVCLRHNEFLSTRVPSDCVLWIPARYRSKVDWSVIGPRLADNGEPVPSDCVLWIPARYRSKVDWSVIGPRLADNGEPGNGERSNAHVLCLWEGGVRFELLLQNIITQQPWREVPRYLQSLRRGCMDWAYGVSWSNRLMLLCTRICWSVLC